MSVAKKNSDRIRKLVECSVMIALATALSFFKLIGMPYGGSVTFASMLPVIIISYRNGLGWGLGSGVAYAFIQQMLGLNNLSYFTTWQSVVAVVALDYAVAFAILGLGGIFRGKLKRQSIELALGTLVVCAVRYACHVISGATVWAGISIPTAAALIYSLGYNATYMIPETVIAVAVAYYVGSMIDLRSEKLTRLPTTTWEGKAKLPLGCVILRIVAATAVLGAVIFDFSAIFSHLQDAETGAFTFADLPNVAWGWIIAVSLIAATLALISAVVCRIARKRNSGSDA